MADFTPEPTSGFDPELDKVLKKVLQIIYKDHPLSPNQILVLKRNSLKTSTRVGIDLR